MSHPQAETARPHPRRFHTGVRRAALALAATGAAALLLAAGCETLPGEGWASIRVRKGEPFIVTRTTNTQWGLATHPTLAVLGGGRIVCRFNTIGDLMSGREGIVGAAGPVFSDNGGITWQAGDPLRWASGPPTRVPVEFRVGETTRVHYGYFWGAAVWPDGHRVLLHRDLGRNVALNQPPLGAMAGSVISSEDGVTWEAPRDILVTGFPNDPVKDAEEFWKLAVMPPRAVLLPDGRYLASAYNEPRLFTAEMRLNSSVLLQSTNRGATFEYVSTIATKRDIVRADRWGTEGPCEPTLARLPDGELLSVMRTGEATHNKYESAGYCLEMLEARSRDEGRTWQVTQMNDIRGVMPCLVQMSNGVLALGYGRPGVRVIFSVDGGHSWSSKLDLVPYNRPTTGYLDMVEISPGRLLIVYDQLSKPASSVWLWEPPAKENIIYGVFVDVQPRKPLSAGG